MKTCLRCHKEKPSTEFYSGRSTCKPCVIARVQTRSAERKDEKAAYDAARYAQDPEPRKAQVKKWATGNPGKVWEQDYRKRTKRYELPAIVEPFTREDLIARYGDQCHDCGGPWDQLEHVVPVIAGGPHSLDNCIPICGADNRRRWKNYLTTHTKEEDHERTD